jgi:hypothetical protein
MTKDDFLDDDALRKLTGYKVARLQIDQLRNMGLPFFVNGHGKPVVPRAAVDGKRESSKRQQSNWHPAWAE